MANYVGTNGTDTFNGADGIGDRFLFAVAGLSSLDTAVGGAGAVSDVLEFTTGGVVTASMLSKVSGMEYIKLAVPGVYITLTAALAGGSQSGTLIVTGSSGNDTVNATAGNDTTKRVYFQAGGGDDVFLGGRSANLVTIGANELTSADVLSGGGGTQSDTLRLTSAESVADGGFDNVTGFEVIQLAAGGNRLLLGQATVGSSVVPLVVTGGAGGDSLILDADVTGVVVFRAGEGNNIFDAIYADSDSFAYGGSDRDYFVGGAGDERFYGGGGGDYLAGANGNNLLDGGAGRDTFVAGSGVSTIIGGADADAIFITANDGNRADLIRYLAVTDGGDGGDTIGSGNGVPILDGDIRFQFSRLAFNTLGSNFDRVATVNGPIDPGNGNAVDGADLVLYNNSKSALANEGAVDIYLAQRYYTQGTGAFVLTLDNRGTASTADDTATLYYDPDAYTQSGGVVALATITNLANFAAIGDNFAFI